MDKETNTLPPTANKTNQIIQTIYTRRAVRKYQKRSIEKEIIEQLLDAGRMAPSAINMQPWHFTVLTDAHDIRTFSHAIRQNMIKIFPKMGIKKLVKGAIEGIKHLSSGLDFIKEEDPVFHGAPLVIFISAPVDNEWAQLDIGMCAQNIMLAAKSLGLDSCPVGFGKFIAQTDLYPKLRIPPGEQVLLSIVVGYGNESPEIHPRKRNNVTYL